MKIHRFIGDFDLKKEQIELVGETAHQISRVLKLKTGEKIELCDGKHISAMAEIDKVNKSIVLVKILNKKEVTKNAKNVTLYCAVLKKENFEMVVQKATECGITKIVPIVSDRTIKTGINIERLRKIAKEAAEQSGRINVPEISELEKFNPIKNKEINIMFDVSGDLFSCILEKKSVQNIWIGPEGGWTPEEIKKAKSADFVILSLGPLTLRGETAAIIASYLAVNL